MTRCIEANLELAEMVSDGQGGMVPADNVDEHGQCTNEAHPDLTICIRCARFYASDALVSWMSVDPQR